MLSRFPKKLSLIVLVFVLAACSSKATLTSAPPPQASPTIAPAQATDTPTPAPPTPTSEPPAATVNGETISVTDFNAELQRFKASLKDTGKTVSDSDAKTQTLESLIDERLLEQAAIKDGYQLNDDAVQKKLDDLTVKAGGEQALGDWMKNYFYTLDSLKAALSRSLAAAWERDRISAGAPTTADQVHARQMLFLDSDTADRYYQQLKSGADFATLAFIVDPDTGGDLGWFPKSYLVLPEIEAAAFALKPGQYSEIIKTTYGYQIIYVEDRDGLHPLSTDARRALQRQLVESWLKDQRANAKIEIFVK